MTDNPYAKYISEQAKSVAYRGSILREETYEFDVVDDEVKRFVSNVSKMGLKAKVVNMKGPGGDNPVVSISGKPDQVLKAVRKLYDPDIDKSELEQFYKVK